MRARAALAAIPLLCGCAAPAPATSEPRAAPERALRLLVAPVDARALALYDLAEGAERLDAEIAAYLSERGHAARAVPRATFEEIWSAAALGAGGLFDASGDTRERYQRTLVETLDRLAHRLATEYDALVLPSVKLRQVAYRGARASWDGVTRPVRVRNLPRGFGLARLSGDATALSLRVVVYARAGEQLFAGFGGLDVTTQLDWEDPDGAPPRRLADSDRAHLREGVRVALEPYLAAASAAGGAGPARR